MSSKLIRNHVLLASIAFNFSIFLKPPTAIAAKIDDAKSTLAIVTEKEGVASALAHRHIIVATRWSSKLDLKLNGKGSIESGSAEISIPVADLVVDSPEAAKGILSILSAGNIWDASKHNLSPENSAKVRENMLAESQLDAAKSPRIESQGVITSCRERESHSFVCILDLTVTIKGRSVKRSLQINLNSNDGEWRADFLGRFKFTEFDIKPYTALLGAIAVSNEFVLAGKLVARDEGVIRDGKK